MNYLIAGLGNPGSKYDNTRHNIGFEVLDELARKHHLTFVADKHVLKAEWRFNDSKILLIKPQTYMNLSGKAVSHWLNWYKIPITNLLVITDDIALPTGKIRIRAGGSSGGHNGLKDIESQSGTKEFPRLRFGVGNNYPAGRQADYVLSPFSEDEKAAVNLSVPKAIEAVETFVKEGINRTMTLYN